MSFPTALQVISSDGVQADLDIARLRASFARHADGLAGIDVDDLLTRMLGGIHDRIDIETLSVLAVQTAADAIGAHPDYSTLAARLLVARVERETHALGIDTFAASVAAGRDADLIAPSVHAFVVRHAAQLNASIDPTYNRYLEHMGTKTLLDRYVLRQPHTHRALETPQFCFMRVACGLASSVEEAIELYHMMASLTYLPSSPTLFNAGTTHPQLSSCYVLDSPEDTLTSIYQRFSDIAQLTKYAGGIGVAYHRVRGEGSRIGSIHGASRGIIPFLKVLDASVAAVSQAGRRKGACCVYLETWHADIETFLRLHDNTGDEMQRTLHLNLAHWVPDLFMERVRQDAMWSLFDPHTVPHLADIYGDAFAHAYAEAEGAGIAIKQVHARGLFSDMMRMLAQTGNGWITFKDPCNQRCNQAADAHRTVHSANLCTEVVQVTSANEIAVCNLGSLNLSRFVRAGSFDWQAFNQSARAAVRYLDRVIDINFYPLDDAKHTNYRWRPVGLGVMGLQDVFFALRYPFDSPEALALSNRIQEELYFAALTASCELAESTGPCPAFAETHTAQGKLQYDLWNVQPRDAVRWATLKARIAKYGLRNALLMAIAPTATIAAIAGTSECIEPQIANLYKRESLSGDHVVVNRHLVADLTRLDLWTAAIQQRIKAADGSVQEIQEIPADLRRLYRTAWELPQKAIIDMAAGRGPYIDQSQSVNLFMAQPTIGKLSSMYMYAWSAGLKTTYYLRSRPATRISQTAVQASAPRAIAAEDCEVCA